MKTMTQEMAEDLIGAAFRFCSKDAMQTGKEPSPHIVILSLTDEGILPRKLIDLSDAMSADGGKDLVAELIDRLVNDAGMVVIFASMAWYTKVKFKGDAIEIERKLKEIESAGGLSEQDEKGEALIINLYCGASMWMQINDVTHAPFEIKRGPVTLTNNEDVSGRLVVNQHTKH